MTIYVASSFNVGMLEKDETIIFTAITSEQAAEILEPGFVSLIQDPSLATILGENLGMRITVDHRFIVFDGYFDMIVIGQYLGPKLRLDRELPVTVKVNWWLAKRPIKIPMSG